MKVLGSVYAVLAFLTWFLPQPYRDWVPLTWLESWSLATWAIVALALLLVVSLEGTYWLIRGDYELVGAIQQVVVGNTGAGAGVVIVANIRNVGAPTIIDGWALEAVLAGGRTLTGGHVVGWDQLNMGGANPGGPALQVFKKERALMEQTIRDAIPTGGQVVGVAAFVLPDVELATVAQPGTKIRLNFSDVRGNPYSAEHVISGSGTGPVPYIPGIGPTAPDSH